MSLPPRMWRFVAYNWSRCILGITEKNEVVIVWPRVAHAPIGVKVNRQVYSVQQQVSAKFHPDRLTIGRMAVEKPVFPVEDGHCLY